MDRRLLATAKLNDIDPQAWLADCSPACPTTPPSGFTNCCLGIGSASMAQHRPLESHPARSKAPDLWPSPDAYVLIYPMRTEPVSAS
jgi:hypothetical protein